MKYFLHDTSAFEDEKVSELYLKFGYEGVGLFYCALEKIAKQEKPIKTSVLKHQLNVGKKLNKCWEFMESLGILSSNNGETFNKQLLNFSEKYKIKKEKNAERILQWRKNQTDTENVTHYEHFCNTPKVKESKVNKSKVNDISLKKDDDENLEKNSIQKNSGKFSDFNIQDATPQILQSSLEAWTYATDIELRKKITIDHVKDKWLQFVATNKDSPQWYNSENEIYTHFKRWITKQKFEDGNTKQHNQGGGKVGVSEARTTALQNW